MKKKLTLAAVILLTGAIALPAAVFSQTAKGGNRMNRVGDRQGYKTWQGNRNSDLTTEQREALEKLHEEFYDETLDLRNDLRTKRTELINIMSQKEPDEKKAKAVQKEISDIQAKLDQKRIELRIKVLKINPDAGYGRGLGRQMKGGSIGMGSNEGEAAESGVI